jgi:hypothetical protein
MTVVSKAPANGLPRGPLDGSKLPRLIGSVNEAEPGTLHAQLHGIEAKVVATSHTLGDNRLGNEHAIERARLTMLQAHEGTTALIERAPRHDTDAFRGLEQAATFLKSAVELLEHPGTIAVGTSQQRTAPLGVSRLFADVQTRNAFKFLQKAMGHV